MFNDVGYIELIFENCESIIIPIDRIIKLDFGKVYHFEDYPFEGLNAFKSEKLDLRVSYENENDLKYNDNEFVEPLGMFINNPMSNNIEDRPNILGRIINYNDLVAIEFLNDHKEHIKYVYVPWHDEDDYDNRYMSISYSDGVLVVTIQE